MASADEQTQNVPSYHDLFIQTPDIERTSIFDLPYNVEVHCTRVTGWQVWETSGGLQNARLLAGEFEGEKWLVLDVAGTVIVDSRSAT